jgi:hypothetical protein
MVGSPPVSVFDGGGKQVGGNAQAAREMPRISRMTAISHDRGIITTLYLAAGGAGFIGSHIADALVRPREMSRVCLSPVRSYACVRSQRDQYQLRG